MSPLWQIGFMGCPSSKPVYKDVPTERLMFFSTNNCQQMFIDPHLVIHSWLQHCFNNCVASPCWFNYGVIIKDLNSEKELQKSFVCLDYLRGRVCVCVYMSCCPDQILWPNCLKIDIWVQILVSVFSLSVLADLCSYSHSHVHCMCLIREGGLLPA